MAVVERISHRVAVMYWGKLLRLGLAKKFLPIQFTRTPKAALSRPIADPKVKMADVDG